MEETDMTARQRWRDPIGRVIFATGALLMRCGGWLCGAAGTWDSDTDTPNSKVPGWYCGKVGCPSIGPHEHASGAVASSGRRPS